LSRGPLQGIRRRELQVEAREVVEDRLALVPERVAARGGQRHLHLILAALGRVHPNGKTSLASVLMREASQWKRRGLAVLVSDLYDERQGIVDAVARVRRVGHDVIIFHLLDRSEKLLDQRGTFEFHDLETGETMVADTDRIRKGYVQRMTEQRQYFQREFERAGAEYVEMDTAEPLDKALAVYLRRRRNRRRKG